MGPLKSWSHRGAAGVRPERLAASDLVRLTGVVDRRCFVRVEGWRRPPFERGLRQDKHSAPPDRDNDSHTPASSMRTSPSPVAKLGPVLVAEPARRAAHPRVQMCGHFCSAPDRSRPVAVPPGGRAGSMSARAPLSFPVPLL